VRRTIAVLGMHRSGTSCLTGLLEEAGVYLGDVAKKSPWNAKGNQENSRIMALHDELLRLNGGSWDVPPATVAWTRDTRIARDGIIDSYRHAALWGFKDPRTLLALDGWLEAMPDLCLVGVFRHPLLVARSLQRRNQFTLEQGMRLWLTYNEALLAHHRRHRFPVLSFDRDVFAHSFTRLVALIDLPTGTGWSFFDPVLRHELEGTEHPLPDEVEHAYRALQEIAL